MIEVFDNARRHLLDRDDVIHQASGNGTARHAVVLGCFEGLGKGDATVLFHGSQSERSVSADA